MALNEDDRGRFGVLAQRLVDETSAFLVSPMCLQYGDWQTNPQAHAEVIDVLTLFCIGFAGLADHELSLSPGGDRRGGQDGRAALGGHLVAHR